jgi:hypothetical protein
VSWESKKKYAERSVSWERKKNMQNAACRGRGRRVCKSQLVVGEEEEYAKRSVSLERTKKNM